MYIGLNVINLSMPNNKVLSGHAPGPLWPSPYVPESTLSVGYRICLS